MEGGTDSRERLVAAAVDLTLEHYETGTGLRDVFAYLTPKAVADRAGLSRGLIYHHWGNPDEDGSQAFTRFLRAVADTVWSTAAVPEDLAEAADLLPDDLAEVILALVAFELERAAGRDDALFRASQALTVHGASPDGAEAEVIERLAVLYAHLGEKVGVEPVPPLDYRDIGFAIMCIFEGFAIFQLVVGERTRRTYAWTPSVGSRSPGNWTLAAIAVEGVVRNMTRPRAT